MLIKNKEVIMFKFIVKLLPKKWLVNMLLEVLPKLLTQGFTWLMEEYPESVNEVRDSLQKFNDAITELLEASKDKVFTKQEIEQVFEKFRIAVKSLFEKVPRKKLTP